MNMRLPRPGHTFALGANNQLYEVPLQSGPGQVYQMPYGRTADAAYARSDGLGQHPMDRPGQEEDAYWAQFTKVPQFYVVSVLLGPQDGATATGSTPLRPEPFVCRRVTWATTGDALVTSTTGIGSVQGRCVTVEWDDEFTKFLGQQSALLSALFGDSQGFLDIPRGILLQGKQTLSVRLTRLLWPAGDQATTRFDIVFHGIGLLPRGVNQSGSAG